MENSPLTSKDIIDIIPLDDNTKKLAEEIIKEDNLETTQRLVRLFNLNQCKKNVLRVIKLNQLLDKVSDQMIERFEKRPGEFSNNDLLNYMNVVQTSIDRANKSLDLVDSTPAIQLNQVNVNIEENKLNRESRDRITDAIKAIMTKYVNIDKTITPESQIEEELVEGMKLEESDFTVLDNNIKLLKEENDNG